MNNSDRLYSDEFLEEVNEISNRNLAPINQFSENILASVREYNRDVEIERRENKIVVPEKRKIVKITRVALYARVSTKDKGQDTENQLIQLREYCSRMEFVIVGEYIDYATGKNSDRDKFKQMFLEASQRKFDLVLFWSLDRFSREGVLETLQYLQKLTACKVDWKSYTEQYLDSCGVFREAVLAILATIAKQERIRIVERTLAGIDKAKKEGRVGGRPKIVVNRFKMWEMQQKGFTIRAIAEELKVDKSLVMRRIKEYEKTLPKVETIEMSISEEDFSDVL